MENRTREPYQDSPTPSRSSSPAPTPSSRASTAKPLALGPREPYHDEPPYDEHDDDLYIDSPTPQRIEVPHVRIQNLRRYRSVAEIPAAQRQYSLPYSDAALENNANDVPLAHLYPYPNEAPPSYHAAVRESFRATLSQHIPSHSISTEVDEEAAVDHVQADEMRFTVERLVASIIVSMLLLVIAALLALVAVASFRSGN